MALTYEFNSTDTLITPQEIVDYAPVDPNSYSEQRLPFIAMREEKLFRKCLGFDFYKAMMADKVKYGPTDCAADVKYRNFTEGTSYVEDDVVLYKNRLYKAKVNTNGKQVPTNQGYWILAPRFKKSEYNYFWERYLRLILAFSISNDTLFYRIVSDEPTGLVQKKSDNFQPITIKDAGRVKQEYQINIDDMMSMMHEFLKENKTLYPDYAPLKDECTNCNINKPRHYGFNTRRPRTRVSQY